VADTGSSGASGGLAGRYARALYAFADEQKQLDQTVSEMSNLGQLIRESADFQRLLGSPLYDVKAARLTAFAVLDSCGFGKIVHDFVGVIANNRRLRALPEIVASFAELVAAKRGQITATVTTAHGLTDVQREQLRARLIEAGYGNVNLNELRDPSLLGGMVLRIGARLYDTSLKSRLQRLQFALKGAA
jgi:F-type H+-transporting ATPase subunit delta